MMHQGMPDWSPDTISEIFRGTLNQIQKEEDHPQDKGKNRHLFILKIANVEMPTVAVALRSISVHLACDSPSASKGAIAKPHAASKRHQERHHTTYIVLSATFL